MHTERSSASHITTKFIMSIGIAAIGIAMCAAGISIGETDDAPGTELMGFLLMIGAVTFSVKFARRKV